MLNFLQPLPIGNAVRIGVTPASGASFYRVLRRQDDNFIGAVDAEASIVADYATNVSVLDIAVQNGTEYFYADYSMVSGSWVEGTVLSITPAANYAPAGVDPQEFVRERVQLGLNVEIAAGRLVPATGAIKVWTAPAVASQSMAYPAFSVHLDGYDSSRRVIGDALGTPYADGAVAGQWDDSIGWLGSFTLGVVGVSLNPDERIAMRKAVQRIMVGNMGLFSAAGFTEINFSQRDSEQFSENAASLYFTNGTMTCLAPTTIALSCGSATVTVNGVPASD